MEAYRSGFSSSALATRRGLAFDQAYGVYLTDMRLIVTKEKSEMELSWEVNGTSLFGTVIARAPMNKNNRLPVTAFKVTQLDAINSNGAN